MHILPVAVRFPRHIEYDMFISRKGSYRYVQFDLIFGVKWILIGY